MFKEDYFFFKYYLYKPSARSLYRRLLASQYDTIEIQQKNEAARLKKVVSYVYEKIPFYSKRYRESGFELGDMEQDGWFKKLPILTKQDVREHFDDFMEPSQRKNLGISSTGGSTGAPIRFGMDKRIPIDVYMWRTMRWWGVGPWDDGAYAWRMRRVPGISRIFNDLLWWPKRKICLDASVMEAAAIGQFVAVINKYRPLIVQGYVGALVDIAQWILKEGATVQSPKLVWATAAPLSSVQKNLLESVFHAPVYNQYGCCEVPCLAAECAIRHGMHVNVEKVKMEFVQDDSAQPVETGEWGRTLLTRLDDFIFPLIRYEVGDRGRWLGEKCSCGVTLPLIDDVKGRISDSLRLPSGRIINGEYLTTLFDADPSLVRTFRIVQKKTQEIWIEFVFGMEPGSNTDLRLEKVLNVLREKVRGEVPVSLHAVSSIPQNRGKLHFVIHEQAGDS